MANVPCLNPAHKERSHLPGTAAAQECALLARRGQARGVVSVAPPAPVIVLPSIEQERAKAALAKNLGRIWKAQGSTPSIAEAAEALAEDGWHAPGMNGGNVRAAAGAIATAMKESLPGDAVYSDREDWPEDEDFADSIVMAGISRDRSVLWQKERAARLVVEATTFQGDFRERFDRHAGAGASNRITSAEVLAEPVENYHASVRLRYAGNDLILSIRSDPDATGSLVTVTPADRPHARLAEGVSEPLASVLGRSAERLDRMNREERIDLLPRKGGLGRLVGRR